MNNQIDWLIKQGGLDWAQEHCTHSASVLYRWAETSDYATPFVLNEGARSTVVVTIDIDEELSASEITRALRANGIVDVSGYRGLGRNQLRIGVFPSVDTDDVEALTHCVDAVVEQMRANR